jgi:hypothetical protein
VVALRLLICGAMPGATEVESPSTVDPTIGGVVRMLEAGVDEQVILDWLSRQSRGAGELRPDDLIALTRAGASPEMIRRIVERWPAEPSGDRPATREAPTPVAGATSTEIVLRYRPYDDTEGGDPDLWHLFVYVDGEYAIWSDGVGRMAPAGHDRVRLDLPPGRHRVRLVQERHESTVNGWRHEARVCPQAIEIDVGDVQSSLRVKVSGSSPPGKNGSVSWSRREGEITVEEVSEAGGWPEQWPALCEEIEVNYDAGARLPRAARKRLEDCVRWKTLWPSTADAPERDAVRRQLAAVDFRPEPGR